MKRILGYVAAFVLAALFSGCDRGGVRFVVKCSGLSPHQTYYLTPFDDLRRYYLKDKADGSGNVRFEGVIEQPVYASICNSLGAKVASLFVEKGTITISSDGTSLSVQGTPSNDAYSAYLFAADSILGTYLAVQETTPETVEAYERQIDSLDDALWQNNTDKILGAHLFATEQINVLSKEQLAEWFERFSADMQQHPYMEAVREKLNSEKKIEEKE